jgi:predicted transcriptional regulator
MVLNGAYVYDSVIQLPFTRRKLIEFMSYFSGNRLNVYLTVLISKEFIVLSGQSHNRDVYCISDKGKQVIKELNDSYEIELIKFCSKYNIEL